MDFLIGEALMWLLSFVGGGILSSLIFFSPLTNLLGGAIGLAIYLYTKERNTNLKVWLGKVFLVCSIVAVIAVNGVGYHSIWVYLAISVAFVLTNLHFFSPILFRRPVRN